MVKKVVKPTSTEVKSAIAEARESARADYMKAEKEIIVGQYTLPKKPGKDGYYRVYVKDTSKKSGRRQLFAKGLEELADEIYNYEKGLNGKTRKTFGELFELIEDQKLQRTRNPNKLASVQNTINRHWGTYNKFFRGTEFEKKYIDEITKGDIEAFIEQILTINDLTDSAFDKILAIFRSVFSFAYKEYLTNEDVFQRVELDDFEDMLFEPIDPALRVYSNVELLRILASIREHQSKYPTYMPAYALELQILIGSRRSEVLPLKWDDIDDRFIYITKAQFTVKKTTSTPQHCKIANRPKNKKPRSFPRGNDVNLFLDKLVNIHKQYSINSNYLFPADTPNGIVTNDSLYEFYRRTIKKLGLKRDGMIMGTHSFRRNAITDIVNATNGNVELAAQLCGNSGPVVKGNYLTGYDVEAAVNALNTRNLTP